MAVHLIWLVLVQLLLLPKLETGVKQPLKVLKLEAEVKQPLKVLLLLVLQEGLKPKAMKV
jgi:hypothetical protein